MPQERLDLIRIAKLQRLNCYHQIVTRLTQGESARSVARWAETLHVEGPAGRWGIFEWRKHLWPLARQVKEAKEKLVTAEHHETGAVHTVRPAPEAVATQVDAQTDELSFRDRIPESARQIFGHVEATLQNLDAERILKYTFFRHLERMEQMRAVEQKLNLLLPNGHKEVEAMTVVADKLIKLELGEKWVRGRFGDMPVAEQQPLSEIAQGMAQFDEVDRNLLRQWGDTVFDMIQEVSGGRYKVGRLGADAPGKVTAEEPASKPTLGPDVPRSEKRG